jgi:AraC family transcriptional regulator
MLWIGPSRGTGRAEGKPVNCAVEQAIDCIWERYGEPLSLADIARTANFSRFHFSRMFKDATGVSPGQFLAAVRIHQAKQLLRATSMNVADISAAVGYNSLGSFTNRFTDGVGLSPSRFRWVARGGVAPVIRPLDGAGRGGDGVTGRVQLPGDCVSACVYLGLFDSPIMQRRPRAEALFHLESAQPYSARLAPVPDGSWFVHTVALAKMGGYRSWDRPVILVEAARPVRVTAGSAVFGDVTLRPPRAADPPILLVLPDLECLPADPFLLARTIPQLSNA